MFRSRGTGGGGGGGSASATASLAELLFPAVYSYNTGPAESNYTLNVVNEKVAFRGQVLLEGGHDGGAKTISQAGGGKITWFAGTGNTFADAATNLRIGVQDLDASGDPDGTFDVYADLVGGTDTITDGTVHETAMESGTKTIDHGDEIAITFDLTAVGGSDQVRVGFWYGVVSSDNQPITGGVRTHNGTSWSTATLGNATGFIEFDDGTYGWVVGTSPVIDEGSHVYNLNTATRDEYGNYFEVPFNCKIGGVVVPLMTPTGDFEVCLYEDPLGTTPTLLEAKAIDASRLDASGYGTFYFDADHALDPTKNYAITIRPTTTTNVTLASIDALTVNAWKCTGVPGTDYYAVARVDNSGAFADFNGGTAKTRRIQMSAIINNITAA